MQTVGLVITLATAIVVCATFVRRVNRVPWDGVATVGVLAGAVLLLSAFALHFADANRLGLVRMQPAALKRDVSPAARTRVSICTVCSQRPSHPPPPPVYECLPLFRFADFGGVFRGAGC